MRFVMLMIPGVYQGKKGQNVGAGFAPGKEDVERMMKYNEELARTGVLISLDGFHPPATAARISFKGGKANLTDGIPAGSDILGGYWMIRVKSREEAIQWASRVPAADGDTIELRQVFDMEDFPDDVRKAAENPTVKSAIEKVRQ